MVSTECRRWRIERQRPNGRIELLGFARDEFSAQAWRSLGYRVVEIPLPEPENRDNDGGAL